MKRILITLFCTVVLGLSASDALAGKSFDEFGCANEADPDCTAVLYSNGENEDVMTLVLKLGKDWDVFSKISNFKTELLVWKQTFKYPTCKVSDKKVENGECEIYTAKCNTDSTTKKISCTTTVKDYFPMSSGGYSSRLKFTSKGDGGVHLSLAYGHFSKAVEFVVPVTPPIVTLVDTCETDPDLPGCKKDEEAPEPDTAADETTCGQDPSAEGCDPDGDGIIGATDKCPLDAEVYKSDGKTPVDGELDGCDADASASTSPTGAPSTKDFLSDGGGACSLVENHNNLVNYQIIMSLLTLLAILIFARTRRPGREKVILRNFRRPRIR